MKAKTVKLWKDPAITSNLTVEPPAKNDPARPAVLVCPGGGYGSIWADEGAPVAKRFRKLGFRVFLLEYRIAPHRYPEPQQDILRAIKLIRCHAAEWGVIPNQVAVCGFSAGGHLCACAGTLFKEITANDGDDADCEYARPDAMLLGYPVISSDETLTTSGSFQNLLGENWKERKDQFSLEKRVSVLTPPAFLYHTWEDQWINPMNSILMAQAMRKFNIPVELHIYPVGPHGMQLGYGRADISQWPEQAAAFLCGTLGFRVPELDEGKKRTIVLTFDDACKSHLENVAPILKKYGFGATFFICRFNEDWRKMHSEHQLTAGEIRQLHDMGFEIGNHTWNHYDLRKQTDEEIDQEIGMLNDYLIEAGIPKPVSFAYPGGPFAENAVKIIRKYGFRGARTTEHFAWKAGKTDPMRIPSCPISGADKLSQLRFYQAVSLAEGKNASVLVFHGVPDLVHPHCHVPLDYFRGYMKYLRDNHYRVISMKQFMDENGI